MFRLAYYFLQRIIFFTPLLVFEFEKNTRLKVSDQQYRFSKALIPCAVGDKNINEEIKSLNSNRSVNGFLLR